ncbi:hypothetical protein HNQ96_001702 [Aminobacter lissarensis]|uniref:Uncharacterized protein n=1 Tax=Aminobacter carboxidus TaxID=376165 RepID=A0A8E1WDX3_9HYPH|nr:hypothetical protein [Aminobacter lissarensis]MBB6465844.1 hypothetical protein [Aminobacter lissarensis]
MKPGKAAPVANSLESLETVLTSTVAAIRQDSEKRTRIFVNAVIGKTSGVVAVGGITALISAFGAASTGTAIGSLSGAAATTAQLYWVGSILGLGVAAGSVIVASTGLGVGVVAAILGKRRLLGRPRRETDFEEHEKAILAACMTLIKALRTQSETRTRATAEELRLVAKHALLPIVVQIDQFWTHKNIPTGEALACRPFTKTLAVLPRRKLARCRQQIGQIAAVFLNAPKQA